MGKTTMAALKGCDPTKPLDLEEYCNHVKSVNFQSQSNGCLMRITPLAVWAQKLSEEEIEQAVFQDTRLTHSDFTAIETVIAYCVCIKYLIESKGDRVLSLRKTKYRYFPLKK